ncbi:COX15/CtaA family protein [Thauera sp. WH-1]|uniref:COX15/CtaA family protein n=1 Tax=Thauera sp. WH-1 TaxID=3398230 RepID=UPI0039FC0015
MRRFTWLVNLTLVLTLMVIALGAYTRLTDAGLGCPDWPGCYGRLTPPMKDVHIEAVQARFPDAQVDPFKARNEMVHRYIAGLLGLCVLAIFVVAQRLRRARGLSSVLLALVLFQAALGMWTVTMNLMPVVVVAHLLGGFALLSLLALLRVELGRAPVAEGGASARAVAEPVPVALPTAEPRLGALFPFACVAFGVALAQIALGGWTSANYAALVCHQLPLCESGWTSHFSLRAAFSLPLGHETYEFGVLEYEARMSIHVLHRLGALLALLVIGSFALLCWRWARARAVRGLALALAGLLALQVTLGLVNVIAQVPLANAVAHNVVGACLLAVLGVLVRQIQLRRVAPRAAASAPARLAAQR